MKLGFYWDEFYSSRLVAIASIAGTLIPTVLLISLFIRAVYDFIIRQKRFSQENLKTNINPILKSNANSNASSTSPTSNSNNTNNNKKITYDSNSDKENETSIQIATLPSQQLSQQNLKDDHEEKMKRKQSKIEKISKIRNISKLLLLSSLTWSVCYGIMAVCFVFIHLFFNLTPVSCGNRSTMTFLYGFQRTSLMLFFISRLHHSFTNTIFEIQSLFIKLFVVITIVGYNGASVWYVMTAYASQDENSHECNTTTLAVPAISVVLIDVCWNMFLGLYFQRKLKEVCTFILMYIV